MSDKLKKIIFALVIALLALPTFGSSVFAEAGTETTASEEMSYIILKGNENVNSPGMAPFFDGSATVNKVDGTETIEIGFTGASMIKSLSIQNLNTEMVKNEDGETGTLSLTIGEEIPEVLNLDMVIAAGPREMPHTVRLFLNVDSISDIPETLLQSSLIKDGVKFTILNASKNEVSSMATYVQPPALKYVENGSSIVEFNFTGGNMIKELTVQDYASNIVRSADGKTGTLEVTLDKELPEYLYMDMVIAAGPREMKHTVRVFLNVDSISKIPESLLNSTLIEEESKEEPKEEPKDEVVEEPKEEVEEEIAEDKIYEFDYIVKHETNNEASAADGFFLKPATLISKNGVSYLQLTITNWSMVDYLRTVDGDVEVLKENSDGSAFVQFKVGDNLAEIIMLNMKISVPGMYSMEHEARLVLDVDSKKEVTEETKETPKASNKEPVKSDKNVTNSNNKETASKSKSGKKVEKANQLVPDKAYTVNYVIKHATENRDSAANQFFTNNAVLLTKNGVNYLQLTVANWTMVDSLSTPQGEVTVIRENSDGSALIQLRVNKDLSAPVMLDMIVTVPGMYESMNHQARLFIDESTLKEVSVGDHKIAASSNGNGIMVNPQTGENSNLLLLTLLLIGSGSVIAYAVRKRLVA